MNKTTLLDYPSHVAATVFTGGCNFRCPFCHNRDLVLEGQRPACISEREILDFLEKRRGILSGVCITGGEPTLQPDLPAFLATVKAFGFCVKLDTNGSRPHVLRQLLDARLLDYIAMDIKNDKTRYAETAGADGLDLTDIQASIDVIRSAGIDYEFRTTVVRELHDEESFARIAEWLSGSAAYYLQCYRDSQQVLRPGFTAYTREELERFLPLFEGHIACTGIRGV